MSTLHTTDLKLLRVFLKVVECDGFSAAQMELGLDLSTISNQMATLEKRVGIRLCDRGRGGFRLTEGGREFHKSAERLFGAVAQFQFETGDLRGELSGQLNIGLVDGTVTSPHFALHEAIRRFEAHRSNVDIQLTIELPQDLLSGVRDGRLHLAITGIATGRLKGLEYAKLCDEEYLFYCGRSHPIFERSDDLISLDEIYRHRLIVPTYGGGPPLLETKQFSFATTVQNLEAQLIFLLSGDYLGYLPAHFAAPWVESGKLRPLLPARLCNHGALYLVKRRGSPQTRTLATFIDDVVAAYSTAASS